MFKSVKLTNFRKHTDSKFDFGPGLNVLRGSNERGKTTVTEGMAYALFGSRSLRESLDQCVTWGQPPSSLKVELEFAVNGTDYRIKRGKSGAELFVGHKLIVTGQTEVTKYVESLLGASADAASKLMMANQSALRGALSDGPAAAVALIESLADFDLITRITDLVQEKLPNGNTLALQSRIDTLEAQVAAPVEDGTHAAQAALEHAKAAVAPAEGELATATATAAALLPAAQEAVRLREEAKSAKQAFDRAVAEVHAANARVQSITIPDVVAASSIEALEIEVAAAAELAPAQAAWSKLQTLPDGDEWEGSREDFETEMQNARDAVEEEQAAINRAKVTLAELTGKLIKETHCAFCDKDLSDVPEVVQRNSELAPQIAAAKARGNFEKLNALSADYNQLAALGKRAAAVHATYQACAKFVKLDDRYYPARFTWTGPDVGRQANPKAAQQLAALKAAAAQREQALGRHQEAVRASEEAAAKAEVLLQVSMAATALEQAAAPALAVYAAAQDAQDACNRALGLVVAEFTEAGRNLKQSQAMALERQKARQGLADQLAADKVLLTETNFNNALIKKLRAARPQVADKLWGIVLLTVSSYFSKLRGVPSRVTRSDNGFLVDGQAIAGLSGSTLDILGLAIRVALVRTFLPNTSYLLLDEPCAAMDSVRTETLLGFLATAGFDQVIMCSHDDLSESVAEHVLRVGE